MKHSKLFLIALLLPLFNNGYSVNETTLIDDNGIKLNAITRKLNSSEINFSQTYVQYGTSENKHYIRFATAFEMTENVTSIKYLRHIEGIEDKTFTVNTVYKAISSSDNKFYYDGNSLTSSQVENDYYFACYSAELSQEEFKNKIFNLSFIINDNVYNLTSTSYNVLTSDNCVALFKNGETILQKCIVKKGEIPVFTGVMPTKEDDHQYDVSWDKEVTSINEDTVYNTLFTKKHVFNEGTIVKTPTCLEAGEKKYTCSIDGCDEIKLETIDALGHSLTKVEKVEPTETTDGSIAYYECSSCHNKYSDEQGKTLVNDIRIIRGKNWHLTDAVEVSDTTSITEKDGIIYNDGTLQDTHITFGERDNNASQVIEFDINVSKWKNEWSSITFMYRRWDNNTTYKMVISENKAEVIKAYWDNGAKTNTLDTINGSFLEENKTCHVKIMSRGWDKTFMIDDKVLSHITESDYCAGNFAIYAWETPTYSISNLISRNYQNDADTMANDFPEVWLNKNV